MVHLLPRRLLPCLLVIAIFLISAPATAGTPPEEQQRDYAGGSSQTPLVIHTLWCAFGPLAVGLGGVCFDAPPGHDTVSFTIDDTLTPTPGGWVYFRGEQGELLDPTVHFCTKSFSREIPAGTEQIVIQFWDPTHHYDNPLCSATAGTVHAVFS